MKRTFAVTLLVGAGIGLSGCQSPSLGGLSLWNRSNASLTGSTAPDVGRQKFSGLSQQLAGDQAKPATGMGGVKPPANNGFLLASWKKTAAVVTGGAATTKAKAVAPEDDPLRLDRVPKKIGPEVYVGAARLMENQGNYEEAESKYHEALKAAPSDLNALVGLARLHDRKGEPQKAIEVYQRAVQLHPTSALAFNDMGLCYRRQRQLDRSLTAFRRAIELQPDNAKYHNNLAAALVDGGRSDEAFRELSALNSPAAAHFNLAYLLEQQKQHGDAVRHLEQAIALDPAMTPAREMLAQLGGNPGPATAQAGPKAASQPKHESIMPAAAGRTEASVYTSSVSSSLGQAEPSAAALPQPSYHLGDEAPAAAETALRSKWGSAAWALPSTEGTGGNHPLPPVEE
jgi:Flp pilus assembly protein TadD